MEKITEKYLQKVQHTDVSFVRNLLDRINWKARLIGIKGPRGVGKTTLMLQYIKLKLAHEIENTLYVSLDNIWFSQNKLVDLADMFVKRGGKHLFLDEVHKYPNWSQELKNIYDDHPKLQVVFTGSSLLEILNARADLSRRAVVYHMQGLSFREFLAIDQRIQLSVFPLEEILKNHLAISQEVLKSVKPLQYFPQYLRHGYYPFYQEELDLYESRLEEIINMMLEIELPLLRQVDIAYVPKIKLLLLTIAESAPFVANVSKLSERIGINRNTLLQYLHFLEEIGLTQNLFKEAKGISRLQKPNKIYVDNTNLAYVLNAPDMGNLRETFFANQLSYQHLLTYPEKGDFLIDEKYTFEIGGKGKDTRQIQKIPQSYVAADDIEYGFQHRIPLWLFGFLY
ncbi:ATP-binding protein [Olivibacter sitiensis]|uniref:ATP-binding protein n=1 Tax=Olivibacter sitiensis TaxID=376470 RepID=UPI00048444CD|nr:AAA family ATPase [Olivibacter sitiensis]